MYNDMIAIESIRPVDSYGGVFPRKFVHITQFGSRTFKREGK